MIDTACLEDFPPAATVATADLIKGMKVSPKIKDLILDTDTEKGARSEAIMSTLKGLTGKGIGEDIIFFIFDHYPIGAKFREEHKRDPIWLRGEISRAKAHNGQTNGSTARKNGRIEIQRITAAELLTTELPEVNWAIASILPEGLNCLGGKPKHGKSILALNLGIAVATGGSALGIAAVEKGTVLYYCLEDTQRRLLDRLSIMTRSCTQPLDKLHLITRFPRMREGGLEEMENDILMHSDIRLVIIDTLAKFAPGSSSKSSNPYYDDYGTVADIKSIADNHNVSILLIHHLRKSDAEDIMDTFSGTLGLTGAADGLLVLKRATGSMRATLHITGRDVDTSEYALVFDSGTLSWNFAGDVHEVKSTFEQQQLFDCLKSSTKPLSPKEISAATGLSANYVSKTLPKLIDDGGVEKVGRGEYIYRSVDEPGKIEKDGNNGKNGKNGKNDGT